MITRWRYFCSTVMINRWQYCHSATMITRCHYYTDAEMITRWRYCLNAVMITRCHYCISVKRVTGWVNWLVNVSNCKELWMARHIYATVGIDQCIGAALLKIEACVMEVADWMVRNQLKLNKDKSQAIIFHNVKQSPHVPVDSCVSSKDMLLSN